MYLDLHSHSVSSDDSRATVEQYVKWVQVLRSKRGYTVDGFVLTEHRKFDFDKDYSQLAAEYEVLILKGSELDTRYGHFLVYGVTEALAKEINLADVRLDARELMPAARHHGAIAIPAHPGRFGIGLVDYMEQGETFADVNIVERLNGGSRGRGERAGRCPVPGAELPGHRRQRRPPGQPPGGLPDVLSRGGKDGAGPGGGPAGRRFCPGVAEGHQAIRLIHE